MDFTSDNAVGADPAILAALVAAAEAGPMPSYGADPITERVKGRLAELFETEVWAFPVATGTAANALALSCLCPPYGSVYAHEEAHILVDECGAPEFMTGGAKLVGLAGASGKLDPDGLQAALERAPIGFVHAVQPAALSLSQATEAGTVYTPAEVAALTEVARRFALSVHMDGARFANALAGLGCSPADLTWRAGVDVPSLGASKNGALAAEVVVFFRHDLTEGFTYRRKRAGHLFSKMRLLSAQLDAYLADGRWLKLAAHANAMAARLAQGLAAIPGISLAYPVEANEVFAVLPEAVTAGLLAQGFAFYRWNGPVVRLVTSFASTAEAVDALLAATRQLAQETACGHRSDSV